MTAIRIFAGIEELADRDRPSSGRIIFAFWGRRAGAGLGLGSRHPRVRHAERGGRHAGGADAVGAVDLARRFLPGTVEVALDGGGERRALLLLATKGEESIYRIHRSDRRLLLKEEGPTPRPSGS